MMIIILFQSYNRGLHNIGQLISPLNLSMNLKSLNISSNVIIMLLFLFRNVSAGHSRHSGHEVDNRQIRLRYILVRCNCFTSPICNTNIS